VKSWKTTVSGVLMIIMAVAGAVQAALAGTDVSVTALLAAISAGVGLIAARDNGVTSEQAGAKRGLGG